MASMEGSRQMDGTFNGGPRLVTTGRDVDGGSLRGIPVGTGIFKTLSAILVTIIRRKKTQATMQISGVFQRKGRIKNITTTESMKSSFNYCYLFFFPPVEIELCVRQHLTGNNIRRSRDPAEI